MANGGTNTLIGGVGSNTFSLNGAGTYNVIGGAGSNIINASGGTSTMIGGNGQNTFNLTGPGTYTAVGGSGANTFNLTGAGSVSVAGGTGTNALNVQAAGAGDYVSLKQNGSSITVSDAIVSSGVPTTTFMNATATNMTSASDTVSVYASAAGSNTLDASKMLMGVSLIGQPMGTNLSQGTSTNNTLIGGAGNDILNGGFDNSTTYPKENDTLDAGNNGDVLYVSGMNSSYIGKGSNQLVYAANPGDHIIVYGNTNSAVEPGLLWTPAKYYNNPLVWTLNSGNTSTFNPATIFVPFHQISGVSNFGLQDSSGTAQVRFAQKNSTDMPGTKVYADEGSYYENGAVTYNGETYGSFTFGANNFAFTVQPGQTITVYTTFSGGWPQAIYLYDASNWSRLESWTTNTAGSWTNTTTGVKEMFLAFNYFVFGVPVLENNPTANFNFNGLGGDVNVSWASGGLSSSAAMYWSWVPDVVWTGAINISSGLSQYGVWSGNLNITTLPAPPAPVTITPPNSTPGPSAQAVASADEFAAAIGQFVNQVAAMSAFAGSTVPVIQQMSTLGTLAQQDAASFLPYSAFDQGVATFLSNVNASGQATSPLVQQQVVALNSLAASGQTNSSTATGLLWFLNNVYFGGMPTAFAGTSVTSIQETSNGTVWFIGANGMLGYAQPNQVAVAVTLHNAPVQISSLVLGTDSTAWFVTTSGQSCYCPIGQTAATSDPLASLTVNTSSSSITAGNAITVTVTAKDAAGNVILDYPGTVTFSNSDPKAAGLPANYTFAPADQGTHMFANVCLKTAGSQTITAAVGAVKSPVASIQVSPAAAVSFGFHAPATTTAGKATITVMAEDVYGNIVSNFGGIVTFSSSDPQALLPPSHTFGVADYGSFTFSVTLKTAGSPSIIATSGSVSGQVSVQVPGPVSQAQSKITITPASVPAGGAALVIVKVQDASGIPEAGLPISLQLLSGSGSFSSVRDNGDGTYMALFTAGHTAGSDTLNATVGSPSVTLNSASLTVVAGPPVKLAFGTPPANTATGLTLSTMTVQVEDINGNVVTSDNTDTVTLTVARGPGSFLGGSTISAPVVNGVATFNNLVLVQPGTYQLSAIVPGLYTGPYSTPFLVAPLQVLPGSFQGTPSGFSLQFNAPYVINSVTPVLYGTGFGASAPVPSGTLMQVRDASGNPIAPVVVEGSLVLNPATNALTFVETDTASLVNNGTPILPDGTYVVDLTSGAATDGFQALNPGGGFLDGLDNGTAGSGDFKATFTVNAAAKKDDVLWLPDTADGPGQPLSAPGMNQAGGGYPVYLASSGNVSKVQATLTYNPSLLTVTPTSTSTFTVTVPTAGTAVLQYNGPLLAAGSQTPIGFISAAVPAGTTANPTPYKAKDLLHLSALSLNSGTIPATASDALHLVAYIGDADGNGRYGSNDAVLITRAALQSDTGFAAYPLVDPVVVADTDGSGFLPADAALQVNEAGVGFMTTSLPSTPIPGGVVFQAIANNVDPTLSLPTSLRVGPDGEVTVPIDIDDPYPAGSTGLIQGHLALTYNPALFSVSPADVHLGSVLAAGSGWSVLPTINPITGQIAITLSSDTPITSSLGGNLVTIDFHQNLLAGLSASPSTGDGATIALVATVNPTGQQVVQTELEDAQGTFTLSPAASNVSNQTTVELTTFSRLTPVRHPKPEVIVSTSPGEPAVGSNSLEDQIILTWNPSKVTTPTGPDEELHARSTPMAPKRMEQAQGNSHGLPWSAAASLPVVSMVGGQILADQDFQAGASVHGLHWEELVGDLNWRTDAWLPGRRQGRTIETFKPRHTSPGIATQTAVDQYFAQAADDLEWAMI
jgi:hypothetical protein